ncbi:hypothetical protein K438DRAFT_1967106 [Mycena galopus ATCC 62051]|nr:hypothetical protein K438DRAFT_1967106 [Mycena galopus ATCC 62051]
MLLPDPVSPFQDKLGTNYTPSDDEIKHLRSLLVAPTEELARNDAQIDEMDIVIRQLRAKRCSMSAGVCNIWRCSEAPAYSPHFCVSARSAYHFCRASGYAMNALQLPSLTAISLETVASALSLPWRGGLDGIEVLDVLRRCPNLRRCHLELTRMRPDPGLASNTSLFTLPHLHTLILGGSPRFWRWIPQLAVPSLRCLQVADARGLTDNSAAGGSDTMVTLDASWFTRTSFLEVLQAFPLLTHLHLVSSNYDDAKLLDDAFLLRLAKSAPELCPVLAHLTVAEQCSAFSDAAALEFVRARMAWPMPLQRFEAQFRRTRELDIRPDLEPFVAQGLSVELKYPDDRPQRRLWDFDPRDGVNSL